MGSWGGSWSIVCWLSVFSWHSGFCLKWNILRLRLACYRLVGGFRIVCGLIVGWLVGPVLRFADTSCLLGCGLNVGNSGDWGTITAGNLDRILLDRGGVRI